MRYIKAHIDEQIIPRRPDYPNFPRGGMIIYHTGNAQHEIYDEANAAWIPLKPGVDASGRTLLIKDAAGTVVWGD